MVRKLKYHEQKLLRKVDFISWKSDSTLKENTVIRRYGLGDRKEYQAYSILAGQIRKTANKLALLDPRDSYRIKKTDALLEKVYNMGLIGSESALSEAFKVSVSCFCRRRLAVVMTRLHMAETVGMANKLIQQGHIRVGPNTITDPAFLVTRNMEDFVTWVDTSKIKQKIMKYNDKLDDFDML